MCDAAGTLSGDTGHSWLSDHWDAETESGNWYHEDSAEEDQPLEESLDTEADFITDMSSVRSQMRQPCSLTPPGPDCADLSLVSTNQRPESWASGQSEAKVIS